VLSSVATTLAVVGLAALAAAALILIWVYNRLVTLRNRYVNALSQIDVQLKRRFDLVPNLVEAARAYLTHERSILEEITRLRAQALGWPAQNPRAQKAPPTEIIGNDMALSQAVGSLTAVLEAYPNLKADKTISDLMEDLASAENRVAFARQAYNDAAMLYNQARETFPAVMFASMMGFGQAWFWWAEPLSRSKPRAGPFKPALP
jgi:LemA protein